MEIFLAILMVLGIFIVVPVIIGLIYIAVASGLVQVIRDRARRRVAAPRRVRRTLEEPVLREVT